MEDNNPGASPSKYASTSTSFSSSSAFFPPFLSFPFLFPSPLYDYYVRYSMRTRASTHDGPVDAAPPPQAPRPKFKFDPSTASSVPPIISGGPPSGANSSHSNINPLGPPGGGIFPAESNPGERQGSGSGGHFSLPPLLPHSYPPSLIDIPL